MARRARKWRCYSSGTSSVEDVPSRRGGGDARTRVTHAALTFPGSPETDTTVTSILRQAAIRGSGECQAAKGGWADGRRGPNPAVVVCFFSRRRTGRGSTGGGRDADLNLWGSFPRRDTAFLAAPVK